MTACIEAWTPASRGRRWGWPRRSTAAEFWSIRAIAVSCWSPPKVHCGRRAGNVASTAAAMAARRGVPAAASRSGIFGRRTEIRHLEIKRQRPDLAAGENRSARGRYGQARTRHHAGRPGYRVCNRRGERSLSDRVSRTTLLAFGMAALVAADMILALLKQRKRRQAKTGLVHFAARSEPEPVFVGPRFSSTQIERSGRP